jgi:hypothetical protein
VQRAESLTLRPPKLAARLDHAFAQLASPATLATALEQLAELVAEMNRLCDEKPDVAVSR